METKYDNDCRKKYYEVLETEPRHAGYSPSQLVSVMVVMECDATEAKQLIDAEETRDYFYSVKEIMNEQHYFYSVKKIMNEGLLS
jgi:hypothetical protein